VTRLSSFALAIGLVVALPAVARADLPKMERPGTWDQDQAKLQRAIKGLRSMLQQLKKSACRQPEAERELERYLLELEWA
jgi:hypothetical protein